jgi:hypothetical protein
VICLAADSSFRRDRADLLPAACLRGAIPFWRLRRKSIRKTFVANNKAMGFAS